MVEVGQAVIQRVRGDEALQPVDAARLTHSQYFPYELVSEIDDDHFWFRVRNEIIFSAIRTHLPNWQKAKFLEIGSGAATVLDFLDTSGMRSLEGCDINPLAIEISRHRLPRVTFNDCSYDELVNNGKSRDAIGMFDFIEHFADDTGPLKAAYNLLNPGGVLFISVPAHQSLYSNSDRMMGHYRRYSKKSLTELLVHAGFAPQKVSYVMPTMCPLIALKRQLIKAEVPEDLVGKYWALVKEVDTPSKPVNVILKHWLRAEHGLVKAINTPFGGSLIACAVKPVY
jgi:SAM-dependent methyltransferase